MSAMVATVSDTGALVASAGTHRERSVRLLAAAEQARAREQVRTAMAAAEAAQTQQATHQRHYDWTRRPGASAPALPAPQNR